MWGGGQEERRHVSQHVTKKKLEPSSCLIHHL